MPYFALKNTDAETISFITNGELYIALHHDENS